MDIQPVLRAMANDRGRVAVLIVELALTMAIAVNGIGLLISSLEDILAETGIAKDEIVVFESKPFWNGRDDTRRLHNVALRDLETLRVRDDVVAVAAISPLPLQGGGSSTHYTAEGASKETAIRGPLYRVSPGALDALGLELIAGRDFTMTDMPPPRTPKEPSTSQGSVIVTKALADALFPHDDALGKVIHPGSRTERYTIVGILRHMRTPYGGGPMEQRIAFFPRVAANSGALRIIARTSPDGRNELVRSGPDLLREIESERVVETQTLEDVAIGGLALQRFLAKGLGLILMLLGFVSALAIYGVHATAVTRRRRQIGMRRALGATRGAIVRYFLTESFVIATIAMAIGVPIAYSLNYTLISTQDVDPLSGETVLASIIGFWILSIWAAMGPAYRAATITPAVASKAR